MRDSHPDQQTKVCFISQWYAPEPTSVPVLTAHELQKSGFRVHVLTGLPNRALFIDRLRPFRQRYHQERLGGGQSGE